MMLVYQRGNLNSFDMCFTLLTLHKQPSPDWHGRLGNDAKKLRAILVFFNAANSKMEPRKDRLKG